MNLKMIQFVTTSISTHPLSLFVFTHSISPPTATPHLTKYLFIFSSSSSFSQNKTHTISPTCLVKWYSCYKFPNVLCIPRRQLDYHTHHHHPKQEWVQTTRPTTDHVTQLLSLNIFLVVHNSTTLHAIFLFLRFSLVDTHQLTHYTHTTWLSYVLVLSKQANKSLISGKQEEKDFISSSHIFYAKKA